MALMGGCSVRYEPQLPLIEPHMISHPGFDDPLSLKNTQNSASDTIVKLRSGHTLTVNYREYTDLIIQKIKTELEKRGKCLTANADKTLGIAVIGVDMITFAGGQDCQINLTVATGGKNLFGLEATAQSMSYKKAINYALAEAAIQILNDRRVHEYLKSSHP